MKMRQTAYNQPWTTMCIAEDVVNVSFGFMLRA